MIKELKKYWVLIVGAIAATIGGLLFLFIPRKKGADIPKVKKAIKDKENLTNDFNKSNNELIDNIKQEALENARMNNDALKARLKADAEKNGWEYFDE